MELMHRPFKDEHDMFDTILSRFNALVEPNDKVIHLGDVCWSQSPEWLHKVALFNGNKTKFPFIKSHKT